MSGKSGGSEENPFSHQNLKTLSGKIGPFCNVKEVSRKSEPFQELCNILKSSVCTVMPLSFLLNYVWLKDQRSTRSMMNVMVVP